MKFYLSFLVTLLFICTNIFSQNQKINWGPEIDAPQFNLFIGEDESNVYISNIRLKGMLRPTPETTLLKIDKKTQKVAEKIEYGNPLRQGEFLIHNYWKDGRVEGLLLNNKKIEKVKMDVTDGIQEATDVDRLEKRVIPIPDYGIDFSMIQEMDMIECMESNDKSKVVTEVTYSDKKSTKMVYTVYENTNYYEPLYTFDFNLERKNGSEYIMDVSLADDGKMAIILKDYFTKDEKESKKKKPNYSFTLLLIDLNGDITEVDLGTITKYWKGPSLAIDSKGGALVSSMTQDKPNKGATGIRLMKYDATGNQVFVKNHPLKSLKEGKSKLDKSYGIAEAIRCTDDAYILISKNNEFSSRQNIGSSGFATSTTTKFETEDILVDGFDGEGNYLWSKKIYRKTREYSYSFFSDTPIFYDENGVTIYLNSDHKNIEEFDNPKQKEKKLPSKNNVIVAVSIGLDGAVDYNALCKPDKYSFGTKMIKKMGDQTYFMAFDRKRRKIKFGVLD